VKQFAAKYKAKYGSDPNGYEVYGYDIGNVVASALQKAGSPDKEKLIDVLHKETVPGVLIPGYRFDENGDVIGAPMTSTRSTRAPSDWSSSSRSSSPSLDAVEWQTAPGAPAHTRRFLNAGAA